MIALFADVVSEDAFTGKVKVAVEFYAPDVMRQIRRDLDAAYEGITPTRQRAILKGAIVEVKINGHEYRLVEASEERRCCTMV